MSRNTKTGPLHTIQLTARDVNYILSLIGADIVAMRAHAWGVPKGKNTVLQRAYSVRDRICKATGGTE